MIDAPNISKIDAYVIQCLMKRHWNNLGEMHNFMPKMSISDKMKFRWMLRDEGPNAVYVWLGEVATGADEPEFSRPGDVIHDT